MTETEVSQEQGSRQSDREDHQHEHEGDAGHGHAHGGIFGEHTELIFAVAAGALTFAGWLIERASAGSEWLPLALYLAAYACGAFFTAREAIGNLRARRFEIDTLMLVAAAGAAALGQWAEGAVLLFLFSLGHALEHFAMGRARKAIEALAHLAPDHALVRRDGKEEEVAVADLKVGDTVLVKPNERLPADGVVAQGSTSVDQAPVTGESVPVDKVRLEGDIASALANFSKVPAANRVYAGTINGAGAIEIQVARLAKESTMARVVRLVTEAQAQRSPAQDFTARFQRYFVPAVLLFVGLLMFAWVVRDEAFSVSFYRAMAVLVAASPCALAISVPSAVLSGVARAGRGGVLIKGGAPLENLGSLCAIAFDKTGTLTEGKPRLVDVVPAPGASEDDLLAVGWAVEAQSDHPLAAAIVQGIRDRQPDGPQRWSPATEMRSVTGKGVEARIGGREVRIGKASMFAEVPEQIRKANDALKEQGRTTVIVRYGDAFLGVFGLMDTPRANVKEVMGQLDRLGIRRRILISGDNQNVADAVGQAIGLTEAKGDLLPEEKVTAIERLKQEESKVAMVGDGVNDAPALAHATVGIAMGAAGSDVALEAADVALMGDDLSKLAFAVELSRHTSRAIRQNLWVSLGMVAVLIPATLFGLNIGTAVLFHEGSTLLVVINGLRLLAFSPRT
ncbi:heavy metal translocating P-type ATPase [Zemynaea arenosa]|uniref:heavy metal translocating P-type ATPase n=1 Tax=Zemynaea arenosa TaxID=2561931 RepID=UPI001E62A8CB|nr:heavy metal translocating P-type ATPase [Massilia arenosa]